MDKSIDQKLLISRLDILLKYGYIRAYTQQMDYAYRKNLYIKHIALFNGGIEDSKKDVNDFVDAFNTLIVSFQENGFDEKFPIQVTQEGQLLNGAHRYACSLYFDVTPVMKVASVESGQDIPERNMQWFLDNTFESKDLCHILRLYMEVCPDVMIYIIRPSLAHKRTDLIARIDQDHSYIGEVPLTLSPTSFAEAIYDLYSYHDHVLKPSFGLDKKIDYLQAYGDTISICLFQADKDTDYVAYKNQLRAHYIDDVDALDQSYRKFLTFHSGESTQENIYISQLFLNRNNVYHLMLRNRASYPTYIEKRIKTFVAYTQKLNTSVRDYCIVGSTVLDIYGLKTSRDLDCISNAPVSGNSSPTPLSPEVEFFDYEYSDIYSNYNIVEDATKHFLFRGIKCVSLPILREIKQGLYDEKHLSDIQGLNNLLTYHESSRSTTINNTLSLWRRRTTVQIVNHGIYYSKKIGVYTPLSYIRRTFILRK